MFEYPTPEWMALRDLDGPEMNTLNRLSRGIAYWLDSYRDLGHDAELMLRVERIGGGQFYQLVADLFWGGKAVDGRVTVVLKACKTDRQREILERMADLCDSSVDRSEDEPDFPGCPRCKAAREDIEQATELPPLDAPECLWMDLPQVDGPSGHRVHVGRSTGRSRAKANYTAATDLPRTTTLGTSPLPFLFDTMRMTVPLAVGDQLRWNGLSGP